MTDKMQDLIMEIALMALDNDAMREQIIDELRLSEEEVSELFECFSDRQ
jgi:DNA-binding transcriptional regulator LsrR (DeoR family)